MNDSFVLTSPDLAGVALRTAAPADCEDLRRWKNEHREAFFTRELITPEGQRRWFAGYLERPQDWMFLVLDGGDCVGCMGFRARDGQVDVYNVILGKPQHGGRGVMARALRLLCSYARQTLPGDIVARVLEGNPAADWYRMRGFELLSQQDSYRVLRLGHQFVPVAVERSELAP
jgi:RimJ/RimL family protein N-acetyltransferase